MKAVALPSSLEVLQIVANPLSAFLQLQINQNRHLQQLLLWKQLQSTAEKEALPVLPVLAVAAVAVAIACSIAVAEFADSSAESAAVDLQNIAD